MKLDPAALALLEAPENAQAVMDFLLRLAAKTAEEGAMPPAAYAAFERAREERRASGQPGYTILRADDALEDRESGTWRAPRWRIERGATVVATTTKARSA
jgi:hypothetical protein